MHFQLAGSGGCFFLMKHYCRSVRPTPSAILHRCWLAFCTPLGYSGFGCGLYKSSLASSFPSASRSSISFRLFGLGGGVPARGQLAARRRLCHLRLSMTCFRVKAKATGLASASRPLKNDKAHWAGSSSGPSSPHSQRLIPGDRSASGGFVKCPIRKRRFGTLSNIGGGGTWGITGYPGFLSFAHLRLYGVKDNQPRPVLRGCLFYALVGQGKAPAWLHQSQARGQGRLRLLSSGA